MDLAWRRADPRSDLGKPGRGGVQGECGGRRLPPADSRLRREHGDTWTVHHL